MKKIFALLLVLAVVFSMVACGEKENEIDEYAKLTANFNELIAEHSQYEVEILPDEEGDDGVIVHGFNIKDTVFSYEYMVTVSEKEKKILGLSIVGGEKPLGCISLAQLAECMCTAMGLQGPAIDELHDKIFWFKEDFTDLETVDGWEIMAVSLSENYIFGMIRSEE